MKRKHSRRKLYTVVEVRRGIAIAATSFLRAGEAKEFMGRVLNEGYYRRDDHIETFATWIRLKADR
jgi:hypothetical protein